MKKLTSILFALLAALPFSSAQTDEEIARESCTSIMVGRLASTDGSVMTTHTCDGGYRSWVDMTPAADYKEGAMMEIFDGLMHTEVSGRNSGVTSKGQIPQVAHTYAFLNTAYPCINEKQLGIGETTISGNRDLVNPKAMFRIEELERVVLQRCTTAREAIKLIGQLVKEYGYCDSGECITIADPKEVWHFEIFGEGKDRIGGVWAAVRIPDDEVGVSANISRISALNLKDKDHYMASDNVFEVAKRMGLWDGKKPFSFCRAYGQRGQRDDWKPYSVRELFILRSIAPSLGLNASMAELPISVKPEKKLSPTDIMAYMRTYYEGTDFDITRKLKVGVKDEKTGQVDSVISIAANPWMRNDEIKMLNTLKPGTARLLRPVAVGYCSYSTVIQLRGWLPDAVGGVVWFGLDTPTLSPRVPIFCGATSFPELYKVCGNQRYREDSALWRFRRTDKLASLKWGQYRKVLEPNRDYFERKGQRELPLVEAQYQSLISSEGEEAARKFLSDYTSDFLGAAVLRWDEMYSKFFFDGKYGF